MNSLSEKRQNEIVNELLKYYINIRHKLLSKQWNPFNWLNAEEREALKDTEAKINQLEWDWAELNGQAEHFRQSEKLIKEAQAILDKYKRKRKKRK